MKINIKTSVVCLVFILYFQNLAFAQKTHKPTGFIYTGELFDDPEWGWSYKTSEQDRLELSKAQNLMVEATKKIMTEPGDYNPSITDMSFAFDAKQQQISKANGSKCVTCYFSHNPNSGLHFQYRFDLKLELIEESNTYKKKFMIDDSLTKLTLSITEKRKKDGNTAENEKKLKEEMEKFQKEIESMDPSKLDEKKLAEIEEKSKRISKMGDDNEKTQKISDDTLHAMYGCIYATKSNVIITTNKAMLQSEKTMLTSLKNKKGYYFKEVNIPGCDYACIYFDLYNKSSDLEFSHNPVLVAYIGQVYKSKSDLPKQWVSPFCVRITYSGNLKQINEIYKKIDFTKLRQIVN